MKQMTASAFKAKCLAVLRQVRTTGETVVVTRRGKPEVKLTRVESESDEFFGLMERKGLRIIGDITGPIPVEWKVMRVTKKKK